MFCLTSSMLKCPFIAVLSVSRKGSVPEPVRNIREGLFRLFSGAILVIPAFASLSVHMNCYLRALLPAFIEYWENRATWERKGKTPPFC